MVLAGVMCLFACAAALSMIRRARAVQRPQRSLWLAGAGVVAGCGAWGTHFIAMLAFQAGLPVAYDGWFTVLSALIAMALCGVGFAIALSRNALLGGALAGLAVAAMHYIGMSAVRISADAVWDWRYVAASIVIVVAFGALALWHALRHGTLRSYAAGAALFAFAICAMHFTGMAAVTFRFDPAIAPPQGVVAPLQLALAVAALAILVTTIGFVGAVIDDRLAARARGEAERMRRHIAELEATKAELQQTSHDLSTALVAADAANESKSRFLAAMSHELRTPLNAVIGFAEMLSMETFGPLGSPRYIEYANDIRTSGEHLLSLINDILDLSKLDAQELELHEEAADLGALARSALQMVRRLAHNNGVQLSDQLPQALPWIMCDPRRIKQVIINLLSNAVKFTPEGGRVRLLAGRDGNGVWVDVADTGIGIAPENIARAFERFGQVDSALARKFEGTGLGLPLSRELIALHGGTLTLESAVNVGTTVRIRLPAARIVQVKATAA